MKTLKVGFDLDGVILYNPIRVFRIFAKKLLKPLKASLLHQDKSSFYLPRSDFEKFLWRLIHLTSFKINEGYSDIKKLSKNKNFKLYLITGRYSFLADDYFNWLKKISGDRVFLKTFYNQKNLQPNQFKENMIKKLKLDVYVEDNWDIVEKIKSHSAKVKILWLTNIIDKNIHYEFKFSSLREVCQYLKSLV